MRPVNPALASGAGQPRTSVRGFRAGSSITALSNLLLRETLVGRASARAGLQSCPQQPVETGAQAEACPTL